MWLAAFVRRRAGIEDAEAVRRLVHRDVGVSEDHQVGGGELVAKADEPAGRRAAVMDHADLESVEIELEGWLGAPGRDVGSVVVAKDNADRRIPGQLVEHLRRADVSGVQDELGGPQVLRDRRWAALPEPRAVGVGQHRDAHPSIVPGPGRPELTAGPSMPSMDPEDAARDLYRALIDGWNAGDAKAMGATLAARSLVVGFDGSQMVGRDAATEALSAVFADHQTARYVTKVRSVERLGPDAAIVYAVVGMVPPGGSGIMPDKNAVQTLVAYRTDEDWAVALFQTTPAQLHGRPDDQQALTAELAELA